jgi:hypothetical protein
MQIELEAIFHEDAFEGKEAHQAEKCGNPK